MCSRQFLFSQTKVFKVISKARAEQGAILCQLRRWLPFCKAFAQKCLPFLPPSSQEVRQLKYFAFIFLWLIRFQPQAFDALLQSAQKDIGYKLKWMLKKGPFLFNTLREWIMVLYFTLCLWAAF